MPIARKAASLHRENSGSFNAWQRPTVLVAMLMLTACAERSPEPPASAAPRAPNPLAAEMAGRWMLSSVGAGACAMTFGAWAGTSDGTIAPEGGCPGKFFTSRKWAFDKDALMIRNHLGEPLGKLSAAAPGRFDGQATTGEPITLTR